MFNITFQQIEAFLAIAKYHNMSRAAESQFISQPTLSKVLQRFENGIGFQVFTRSNKGVVLTPEGEYLYAALSSLYDNMDKAITTAKEIGTKERKLLNIIAPSSFDAVEDFETMKALVKEFENKYPDVVIMENLYDFNEFKQQFIFGQPDIAFTQEWTLAGLSGVEYCRVAKYPLYLAMSTRHALASCEEMPPADKLSELTAFAVRSPDNSGTEEQIIQNYRKIGVRPRRVVLVENFQTLLHTLKENRGMSLCAKFTGGNEIKYYPTPENMWSYLVVAWYPDRITKQAKEFIKLLPEERLRIDECKK